MLYLSSTLLRPSQTLFPSSVNYWIHRRLIVRPSVCPSVRHTAKCLLDNSDLKCHMLTKNQKKSFFFRHYLVHLPYYVRLSVCLSVCPQKNVWNSIQLVRQNAKCLLDFSDLINKKKFFWLRAATLFLP